MATYYLAPTGNDTSGSGSYGSPWKTAEKAFAAMSAGDTCIFKNGTYLMHQGQGIARKLSITKANTTWKAETTGAVILRGNWGPSLLTDTAPPRPDGCGISFAGQDIFMPRSYLSYYPGGGFLIGVNAQGVRIEGLTIENIASIGINFGLDTTDCVIKDNSFYWTLNQAINCQPGDNGTNQNDFPTGILLEGNRSVFASSGRLDVDHVCKNDVSGGGNAVDPVSGAIRVGNVRNVTVRGNTVEYSWGEGFDIGKRVIGTSASPCIVEGNEVHDCRHQQMYVLHAQYTHVRNNVSYAIGGIKFWSDIPTGEPGQGYKIADEKLDIFPTPSNHVYFYGNIAANTVRGMEINDAQVRQRGDSQGKTFPRVGIYVGFNTFVAGPLMTKTMLTLGAGQDSGIVENNLFLYEDTTVDKLTLPNAGGLTIRRNAWTEQPPAAWQTTGTVVTASANMKLGNPRKELRVTGFDYYPTLAEFDAGCSNNFSAADYSITGVGSPLRDAAGLRVAQNGFWPPVEAFTHDRTGAARSSPGDIGSDEYGSENTGHSVSAVISASVITGTAPLTVVFQDDSETEGAASINEWTWLFGDGTRAANAEPHTKTYTAPGVYTVTLTVRDTTRNLSSVDTQAITVTMAPSVGRAMDAVRVAARTTAGAQTLVFNLGGATPDLVLLFATNATAVATKTDGALFCVGALTAAGQWAATVYATDNTSTTKTRRYQSKTCCLLTLNDTGVTGRAVKGAFSPNQVVLTVETGFPAGYLLTAVALADGGHETMIGDFDTATATAIAAGFMPDFMLAATTFQTTLDHYGNNAQLTLAAMGDKQKIAQRWAGGDAGYYSSHNQADSDVRVTTGNGNLSNVNTDRRLGFAVTGSGVGIDRTGGSGLVGQAFYAGIKLGGQNQAVVYGKSPNTTGTVAYPAEVVVNVSGGGATTETIEPGLLFIFAVPFDAGLDSWEYDAFTLAVVDSGATYSLLYADRGEQATTDAWTRAENTLAIRDGAGTLKAAGTVSLTATGFSINWTTVNATSDYSFTAVALRKPLAPGLPVAYFTYEADTDGGGSVAFTDASNPVGSPITSWAWEFGDGGTSEEQHPDYIYDESGTYTVTLTVTNATGSDAVSLAVTVGVSDDTYAYPIGPYDPMTVTNYTVNALHGDLIDPDFMRSEAALDLDALVFDATPADKTTTRAGKVRIVADLANNRLKVIYPSGTVKYITLGNS